MFDLALILELAPLAAAPLKRFLRGDLARSLDRRVRAEFESDAALGPGVTDALITEWSYIHHDPRGAVIIAGLLKHGDPVFLEAFRHRASELMDGLETLPWSVPRTVDRLVAAVRNNFVAAQRDAAEAAQRGTTAVLSAIEPLASKSDMQDLGDRLERALTPPRPRILLLAASFDEHQQRRLSELHDVDRVAAGQLGQLLDTSGVDGLSGIVRSPPSWAIEESAMFWQTAGRVLVDAGRLADAERRGTAPAGPVGCGSRRLVPGGARSRCRDGGLAARGGPA